MSGHLEHVPYIVLLFELKINCICSIQSIFFHFAGYQLPRRPSAEQLPCFPRDVRFAHNSLIQFYHFIKHTFCFNIQLDVILIFTATFWRNWCKVICIKSSSRPRPWQLTMSKFSCIKFWEVSERGVRTLCKFIVYETETTYYTFWLKDYLLSRKLFQSEC